VPRTKEKAPANWRSAEAETSFKLVPGQVEPITQTDGMQADFSGETRDELEKRFTERKKQSVDLSKVYSRLYRKEETAYWKKKAENVSECGTFLSFAYEVTKDEISQHGKLYAANFCKDRLCPMCSWRRSRKIFGQVSKVMDVIGDEYLFLFLTLTVPNVPAEKLSETLTRLYRAFNWLLRYKAVKKVVKGYFRALEVTYSNRRKDYHPHFHVILAVPKGYLKSRDYLKREEWLRLWKKAYKDETITQLDIRKCENKHVTDEEMSSADALKSAVAEAAKYAVKLDLQKMSDDVIRTLALCLHGRRLATFDSELAFGKAFKELGLDDTEAETADLVHVDDEEINPHVAHLIVCYQWSCGAYKMFDVLRKEEE